MGSGYVTTWEREIEKRERPITSDGRKQISRIDVRHTFSSSSNGDPCQARQRGRRKERLGKALASSRTHSYGLFGLWTSNQSLSLLRLHTGLTRQEPQLGEKGPPPDTTAAAAAAATIN